MAVAITRTLPRLRRLPESLPVEGAINIVLEDGVPVFRASPRVQARISTLIEAQHRGNLSTDDAGELDAYEDVDDYLSHLNRLVRNLVQGVVA